MSSAPQDITARGLFSAPERFFGELDHTTAAELVTASADIVLIIDEHGIICDVAHGNAASALPGISEWVGRAWHDTVTTESRPKLDSLMAEAVGGGTAQWRQVNHPQADGTDFPVSYVLTPIGRTSDDGVGRGRHYVAFGRDLRSQAAVQQRLVEAQLAMERDYWRLRQIETRYRLLFQTATDAMLILDSTVDQLEEANPAAGVLFGEAIQKPGWRLVDTLDERSRLELRRLFDRLVVAGAVESLKVRRLDGDELLVAASLFRQDDAPHFLVRVNPVAQGVALRAEQQVADQLLAALETAPDAFVLTDSEGRVLSANRAFLDLAQLGSKDQARAQSLEKWLGRAGVDLRVLLSTLRQHGAVRLYATVLRGEFGSTADVEISASAVVEGGTPCLGFTIRDVGRRLTSNRSSRELPRSASQMTELVGRLPLRDIVRETTDLIEQLCIEAALGLTGNNRASAAEMLGLSRQSLYVKLRRFGIGDPTADEEDAA